MKLGKLEVDKLPKLGKV